MDAIRQKYPTNQSVLDALDSGYLQQVGVSDEHDGLVFTVKGIIAEDARMIVLYTVQGWPVG